MSGLPVPGTLEHTVALTLFNAQQYINQMFKSKPSQDINKIGVAADATPSSDTGIIGAVSSLPQSMTNAAVQVLKFVNPAQEIAGQSGGSQSYSEVVTGVDPAYAALGVLTTGAIASVAYSAVTSDSDLASSATNLALGAVDAIARNDVVKNIADNDIVNKLSNKISENPIINKAKNAISKSKFIKKASSAIQSIVSKIKGKELKPAEIEDYDKQKLYNVDNVDYSNNSPIYDYSYSDGFPSNWDDFQTHFDYYQEVDYSDRYPYQESQSLERIISNPEENENIEWYEPTPSSIPEKVPFIKYSEDHNPWHLLNTGQSTDHLYRGFN